MNNKFIYNESINEIIKRRKSVRTYKTDEVSNEIIEKLNKYIEKLNGVFLSLIHISEPTRPHSISRMPSSA